jgi:hypothetical protein
MAIMQHWALLGASNGLTIALCGLVIVLCLVNWRHGRRIRKLEARLGQSQQALRQEIKMMGQGAIGVGHRVKHLEKQIRKQPSAYEQLLMQQTPSSNQNTDTVPAGKGIDRDLAHQVVKPVVKRAQSRAEQALAQWMKETRHTA